MRVIFMGTPDFSVATLEKIIEAGHDVVAVFTQPDKPKGRGKTVQFPPVKITANNHNLPVYQPVKVRDPEYVDMIKNLNPDVIVVVAFGQILPKTILEVPKYGCINVHASLLPKYRGAAPIQWSIIDGEKVTGVTTMRMDEGLDTGDMILKTEVSIEPEETAGTLHDKLSIEGALLCVKTLKEIEEGTVKYIKQDNSKSNYVKTLEKSLGNIDWNQEAVSIERLIRGLNPWPSAYTSYQGKMLKIWSASVLNRETEGKPGEVLEFTKDEIRVKTKKGILRIKELQLEGKKRMTTEAFLRGFKMEKGSILG